jgi:hypothetical protein
VGFDEATRFGSETRVGQCVSCISNDDNSNFICPEPRGPTELLENVKNRFQIGLLFPEK